MKRWWRRGAVVGFAMALATSGCAGCGRRRRRRRRPTRINVLMVNNPQMVDLQKLTADNFTKQTGITVNFTVLPENDVRDKISQEFSSQAGQYDVATLSATSRSRSTPRTAGSRRWTTTSPSDPAFDQADILPPMTAVADRRRRQGLRRAVLRRVVVPDVPQGRASRPRASTMPDKPTWQQVADIAAKVDGAQPGMKGICLRGQPGWGQIFAPLTTVVNTFGGTWFDKDWNAQVNAPEFKEATNFYVDLVQAHGEAGAPQAGFTECLNNLSRARSPCGTTPPRAAGSLEAADSPVKGKIGYVAGAGRRRPTAPAGSTPGPGASRRPARSRTTPGSSSPGPRARTTRSSSASKLGWSRVPAGKRASTYENPDYLKVGVRVRRADRRTPSRRADPSNPGVQPRPARRHPVRRHPGVHRPGHPGLAGRQLGHRRPDDASTRRWTRASSWPSEVGRASTRSQRRTGRQRRRP